MIVIIDIGNSKIYHSIYIKCIELDISTCGNKIIRKKQKNGKHCLMALLLRYIEAEKLLLYLTHKPIKAWLKKRQILIQLRKPLTLAECYFYVFLKQTDNLIYAIRQQLHEASILKNTLHQQKQAGKAQQNKKYYQFRRDKSSFIRTHITRVDFHTKMYEPH